MPYRGGRDQGPVVPSTALKTPCSRCGGATRQIPDSETIRREDQGFLRGWKWTVDLSCTQCGNRVSVGWPGHPGLLRSILSRYRAVKRARRLQSAN